MDTLPGLVARHGYLVVAFAIGLESMGIPLPGETLLVAAAIYAGSTHQLHILLLIVSAIAGAIAGDNLGFIIGRRFGYPLLRRYGHLVRIDTARIKLGQLLFRHHGGKVVFIGRFVAVLRALAALLAGVNGMPWRKFLAFNVAGAIVWAGGYGTTAYLFGREIERVSGAVSWTIAAIGLLAAAAGFLFIRRHEAALTARAEREFPGPLGRDRREG